MLIPFLSLFLSSSVCSGSFSITSQSDLNQSQFNWLSIQPLLILTPVPSKLPMQSGSPHQPGCLELEHKWAHAFGKLILLFWPHWGGFFSFYFLPNYLFRKSSGRCFCSPPWLWGREEWCSVRLHSLLCFWFDSSHFLPCLICKYKISQCVYVKKICLPFMSLLHIYFMSKGKLFIVKKNQDKLNTGKINFLTSLPCFSNFSQLLFLAIGTILPCCSSMRCNLPLASQTLLV